MNILCKACEIVGDHIIVHCQKCFPQVIDPLKLHLYLDESPGFNVAGVPTFAEYRRCCQETFCGWDLIFGMYAGDL